MSKNKVYSNIKMTTPDGQIICHIGEKRANWYLSRNIAECVSNNPKIIRLKFEPKSRSCASDNFSITLKENKCVVCGCDNNLTKHHIIPYSYRRHLQKEYKTHMSHDIVAICESCHISYEKIASEYKKELVYKYLDITETKFDELLKNASSARVLLKYSKSIPEDKKRLLLSQIRQFLMKDEVTEEDLSRLTTYWKNTDRYKEDIVIAKIKNVNEFIRGWREHFIKFAKPKYMPKYWDVNRKLI